MSAPGSSVGEPAAPLVADVDGRARRRVGEEEPALRLEVGVHRPVEVEVLVREVRERECAQPDAVEAAQLGGVRRRLDDGAAVAGVEHLAEQCAGGRSPRASSAGAFARSVPTRVSTVPTRPGRLPAASRIEWSRYAVVVFPLVPVTPATGAPPSGGRRRPAAAAIAARTSVTTSCGTGSGSACVTTSAAAPAATASPAKSWPSRVVPGTQKNSVPGRAVRAS